MESLLAKSGLYLTHRNLDLIQILNKKNINCRMKSLIKSTGLVINRDGAGNLEDNWKITDAGSGNIIVQAGKAILSDHECVELEADSSPLAVVDDSTIYYVLLTFNDNECEKGTVSVTNGSLVIAGTNTKFYDELKVGEWVRCDSASYINNEVPLIISSITNNTSLTVESIDAKGSPVSFTTESDMSYSNIGRFATGFPSGSQNENIRNHDRAVLIVATTPSLYDPKVTLGTVSNSGGTLTIDDKRDSSLLELNVNNLFNITASNNLSDSPAPEKFGGGTIWVEGITNGTTEVILDDSVDLRDRFISITGYLSPTRSDPGFYLPGGAGTGFSSITVNNAGTLQSSVSASYIAGFVYTGSGGTSKYIITKDDGDDIIVYVNTSGNLCIVKSTDTSDQEAITFKTDYSPKQNH